MVLTSKDIAGESARLDLYLPDTFEYFSCFHSLGDFYLVENLRDDFFTGDIVSLGFVGETNAVAQYVVSHSAHILRQGTSVVSTRRR